MNERKYFPFMCYYLSHASRSTIGSTTVTVFILDRQSLFQGTLESPTTQKFTVHVMKKVDLNRPISIY